MECGEGLWCEVQEGLYVGCGKRLLREHVISVGGQLPQPEE